MFNSSFNKLAAADNQPWQPSAPQPNRIKTTMVSFAASGLQFTKASLSLASISILGRDHLNSNVGAAAIPSLCSLHYRRQQLTDPAITI
jgi:hypothetical protein